MSAARRRPLEPIELAEAAVLSDVCVALCLLGWLFPFGTLLIAMAVAPMAALAGRHRLRAVIAGAVAGVIASLLVAGTGLAVNVVTCAVLGVVVGAALRRGWSRRATVAVAVGGLGPPAVALTLAVLALLSSLRRLALDQVANSWRGAARILRVLGLTSVVSAVDPVVAWLLRYWWVGIPIAVLATIMVSTWLAYSLARPTLTRLSAAVPPTRQPAAGHRSLLVREDVIPAPVPVSFDEASFRYPGATDDTVREVSFDIRPGEMVALVGPNGSGKSTLTRLLAGWSPTSGAIDRPGASGLGRTGGTALVFQRPETQVLGVRVQDDVMWGLGPESLGPARAALARVGLAGLADRETSTLSGGELQRLALAAAIARQPRLLISDESTAMIDPVGRAEVLALLRGLADDGTAVVHVTHRAEEAEVADRILVVDGGRVSEPGRSSPDRGVVAGARLAEMAVAGEPMPEGDGAAAPQPGPAVVIADRSSGLVVARLAADHVGDHTAARARVAAPPVTLERVGHVFSPGSPWAHRALSSVDLTIDAGEGVMVVGPNGSGKSTLAWILAGLLVPSEGLATLGDQPLDACLGAVGLAFQHPRLQLMRTTVRSDVRAASGTDVAGADDALRSVGLDPVRFAERRIDELSGGQQRRAALAGLLAGRPRLLVLDEPFAGLDRGGREGLSVVLGRLRAESGLTLVIVSHDLDVPASVADRVVRIDRGQVVEDRRIGAEPVSAHADGVVARLAVGDGAGIGVAAPIDAAVIDTAVLIDVGATISSATGATNRPAAGARPDPSSSGRR